MSDEEYQQAFEITMERNFHKVKELTEGYLNQIMPTDKLNELGFKIHDKGDFAKGYAVCAFYMTTNFSTQIFPSHILTSKERLQEEYAKKLIDYFDISH